MERSVEDSFQDKIRDGIGRDEYLFRDFRRSNVVETRLWGED
jgi:hypothetical protein